MNQLSKFFLFSLLIIVLSSCGNDDESTVEPSTMANIELNINGLEDLGSSYAYEGWIIVDGAAVSTGVFTVNGEGELSTNSFEVNNADLDKATAFVLTIEPSPDADPAPSDVHILAGDFDNGAGTLTVGHAAALGDNFTAASGSYILATPTDGGSDTNETSGVWWLDPATGPGPGLTLPTLPAGWVYEGWAVVDGTPISTGRFTDLSAADDFDGFSGTAGGPPYPGEDLLTNAPSGLTFPVDLSGKTVVISVEPSPDNSPAPFTLKPLVGAVPSNALDHTSYGMNNNANATNPTGTVNSVK